jgi:hypothetical protein
VNQIFLVHRFTVKADIHIGLALNRPAERVWFRASKK